MKSTCFFLLLMTAVSSWHVSIPVPASAASLSSQASNVRASSFALQGSASDDAENNPTLFSDFVTFLKDKQSQIIESLEEMDGSGAKFTNDCWGIFADGGAEGLASGGMTRVIQGGDVIERGACSFTLIQQGVLSSERAAAIRSRQSVDIKAGDTYSAAALSIVLHSRSPLVPTFRSDVRVFLVSNGDTTKAWFGGGADLTPYFLDEDDVSAFHRLYQDLANSHDLGSEYTYEAMKQSCDDYFYLPARSEHRGTGGIFFDDLEATEEAMAFVQGVTDAWTPSWFPIIKKHRSTKYTDKQRQWQLLRRGRYLEFNLLYDRGVKFGLANANPRVEGVMVSAPPLIAWEYNHEIVPGSPEAQMMAVLKEPREWV